MTNSDWWRGCAIYQVYPRSFQDSNGDGIGDLPGIIERLPYIASLGVDAIWLSPFFKSPQADMGYDVSDYCAVDPMFGTMEDFDRLVKSAHELGLKIIIDQVLAHTSDRHPWFVESRASRDNDKADWFVWADPKPDGTAPNNWLSVFGGSAWEWESTRKQYYLHNFLASQPALNFHNPAVQDALLDTVRFWLEKGVDGFRLDTVNYYFQDAALHSNPPLPRRRREALDANNPYLFQHHLYDKSRPENLSFLKRFRALLDSFGERASVGEVGDEDRSLDTVAAYTGDGDKLHMCYTFDMLGDAFSPAHFRGCVERFFDKVRDGWVCWAFSNHDVMRHVTRWARPGQDSDDVARFAISLLACLPGSICLYQGEELGMQEAELTFEQLRDPYGIRFWPGFKGRDGCRTPMVWDAGKANAGFTDGTPWLPVSAESAARAVDVQESGPGSVLHHYRAVLAARRRTPALVSGGFRFLDSKRDVLALIRESGSQRVLCAFNFSSLPVKWKLPEGMDIGDVLFSGAIVSRGRVELPPLGFFVAELLG
ncbi:MAG: alpha-glucosidase family protein [Rhizobiaceae bacterium]|nr:alpha-glucosidase family protein [Rhizobiaceae bacterium]